MFAVEDDSIQYLIDKEKENALKYGKFHSEHEFFGVLKEEIEEASFDMASIENELDYLWKDIKLDHMREEEINTIKKHSIYAIHELLQVCAVCDKQLDNMNENKTEDEINTWENYDYIGCIDCDKYMYRENVLFNKNKDK